ncbi:hypothetical protein C8F01DRAFT_615831 [Mycena amicta]|nr:hypothetical protein C8F01DRAFT_615831 [Mycena amicta]
MAALFSVAEADPPLIAAQSDSKVDLYYALVAAATLLQRQLCLPWNPCSRFARSTSTLRSWRHSWLYAALFFATVSTIVARRQIRLKSAGLHGAVVVMFALSTIHVAIRWYIVKSAFITAGDSPITSLTYLLDPPLTLEIVGASAFATNTFISDSVLIWRCWTVWGRNTKIVVLPAISTVAGAVLGYLSVAEQARYIIHPELPRGSFIDFATPYFGLSLGTTLLCTLLIILRIVLVTRMTRESSLNGYGAVIEMVVESAALYSATLIAYLVFLVMKTFQDGYPQAILAQMAGIAPTLIVARVSLGLSRPDESWNSTSRASTMRFRSQAGQPPSSTVLSLSAVDDEEK